MTTTNSLTAACTHGNTKLERLVLDIARWLHGHASHLDPRSPLVPTERITFLEGPLLETVVLCRALQDSSLATAASAFIDQILTLAHDVAGRPETRQRLAAQPQLLPYYGHLFAALHRCGQPPIPPLSVRIPALTAEQLLRTRPPSWLVELRYALDLVSTPSALPPMDRLLADAGLWDHATNTADDTQAYILTHLIFCGSDFGRHPLPGATPWRLQTLDNRLNALAHTYAARADWDLTCELILCSRIAGAVSSQAASAERWKQVLHAALSNGAIPGPHYAHGIATSMPDRKRQELYTFRTSYHTSVVAALAALDAINQPAP